MPEPKSNPRITIRNLAGVHELEPVAALEREVWGVADADVIPLALAIATQAAGALWIGAFDGSRLVGFAFGFPGLDEGRLSYHSHQLAVSPAYRDTEVGYRLKLAQREQVMALRVTNTSPQGIRDARNPTLQVDGLRIEHMTWTFDPLQSKNAHLNFAKLGVVSASYRVNFYGAETSSLLHRNGTDRLWVVWPLASRRVQLRVQSFPARAKAPTGADEHRAAMLDVLSTLHPLVRFNGEGKPSRADLSASLARQRVAIEIPSDIGALERDDPALAQEWRRTTRWAFTEALNAGFFVAEFCRTIRGQQGPGAYLLEKGKFEEYVPEMARGW